MPGFALLTKAACRGFRADPYSLSCDFNDAARVMRRRMAVRWRPRLRVVVFRADPSLCRATSTSQPRRSLRIWFQDRPGMQRHHSRRMLAPVPIKLRARLGRYAQAQAMDRSKRVVVSRDRRMRSANRADLRNPLLLVAGDHSLGGRGQSVGHAQ